MKRILLLLFAVILGLGGATIASAGSDKPSPPPDVRAAQKRAIKQWKAMKRQFAAKQKAKASRRRSARR